MNPATLKTFERMLERVERREARPKRRLTSSPFVLILSLMLANVLLTRLVPMIWETTLPGGLDSADSLNGWPAQLWYSVLFARMHQQFLAVSIAVIGIFALIGSYRSNSMRWLVWLLSLAAIGLNAVIVALALRTSMTAAEGVLGVGFGLG